jgi:hypothetical protein
MARSPDHIVAQSQFQHEFNYETEDLITEFDQYEVQGDIEGLGHGIPTFWIHCYKTELGADAHYYDHQPDGPNVTGYCIHISVAYLGMGFPPHVVRVPAFDTAVRQNDTTLPQTQTPQDASCTSFALLS